MRGRRERNRGKKRASEEAMERTAALTAARPDRNTEERRRRRGSEGLQREAARRAHETGQDPAAALRDLELEVADRSHKVAFDHLPGAPFFRVEQIGGAKCLFINKASRFFQEVHSGPKSTPDVRAALELLLFSIGDRVLEVQNDKQLWYQYEIGQWSSKMEVALGQLGQQDGGAVDSDEDESLSDAA